MADAQTFSLPQRIEDFLAQLSELYKHDGDTDKGTIIANATVNIEQARMYVGFSGDIAGHAVSLSIPIQLYARYRSDRTELQRQISDDLNELHYEQDETFLNVFIVARQVEAEEWRKESGFLLEGGQNVSPKTTKRIWGEDYRIFISHKTEVKNQVAMLKESLAGFKARCFVAHVDIAPTKAWQDEIENALLSMDAFVAVLSTDFHESKWTDQEVGFALARRVPIIALKIGSDPYGFIAKFQALNANWEEAPEKIASLLINQSGMLERYIDTLAMCRNFDEGNKLSKMLLHIDRLSDSQARKMIQAYNDNSQLRGSYGFNGQASNTVYGSGLPGLLKRASGLKTSTNADLSIVIA